MPSASRLQRTIASETEVRGIGFFHGTDVVLRFRPARADTGVVFVRTDLSGRPAVKASIENVVPTPRRTTIRQGDASVEMVEHVLAALAGLRIDNCTIEIDAAETPGCDGSSRAFVEALTGAGTTELGRPRPAIVIDRPVTVRDGQATLTALPGDGPGLVLAYHLDYGPGNPIGAQSLALDVTPESFAEGLAPSRTFLLEAEAHALREAGIGNRATVADLLIFGPEGPLGNPLRFPDECVRHKILDMVGDLALLGRDIHGRIEAHRSGHSLNAALVRALLEPNLSGDADELAGIVAGDQDHDQHQDEAAFDVSGVMKTLLHRYPHLLLDRVIELEPGVRLTAVKDVGVSDPYFRGQRHGKPVMPGVMVLEALAQAATVLISEHVGRSKKVTVIGALNQVAIGTPVVPGDRLLLEVNCLAVHADRATVRGVATVDDRVAAEARIQFVLVDVDRSAA